MNITLSGADYRNRSKIKENNTLSVQRVDLVYKDPVSTEKISLPAGSLSIVDNILYLDGNYNNLAVYAMDGKLVFHSRHPGETVSLSSLSMGVYTLRIEGREGMQTMKFRIR